MLSSPSYLWTSELGGVKGAVPSPPSFHLLPFPPGAANCSSNSLLGEFLPCLCIKLCQKLLDILSSSTRAHVPVSFPSLESICIDPSNALGPTENNRKAFCGERKADFKSPLPVSLPFQSTREERAILEIQQPLLSSFLPMAMFIATICVLAFRTSGPKIKQSPLNFSFQRTTAEPRKRQQVYSVISVTDFSEWLTCDSNPFGRVFLA